MIYRDSDEGNLRTSPDARELGGHIRAARRRRAMTVSALAAATDLDKAYISRIERGQKAPSLAALLSIAGTLDVPVARLLGESTDENELQIMRGAGEPARVATRGKRMTAMFLPLHEVPLDRDPEQSGETLIHALTGSIEISLPDRSLVLEAGDWLMFDGHTRHRLSAAGGQPASALVVVAREDP